MVDKEDLNAEDIVDAFLGSIDQARDPREKAYEKLVDYMCSDEKLLMFSRLNEERTGYIIKNLVFLSFYIDYYSTLKIKMTIKEDGETGKTISEFKYYGGIYDDPIKFLESYKKLIDSYLKTTIAEKGKGREEILKILKATDNEMTMADRLGGIIRRNPQQP